MTTTVQGPHRCIAILKLPKNNTPLYISRARAIVQAMTGNPWFPSPRPDLATVESAIEALDEAQTATLAGAQAETATRNDKRRDLRLVLEQLCAYVQSVADANVANAASIIESAGMYVKGVGGRRRAGFRLTDGRVSGEVDVFTDQAANRASYDWQYSLDDCVSWVDLPGTTKADTTIAGLPRGARVWVRYRTIVKSVTSDWSQPLSIIVI